MYNNLKRELEVYAWKKSDFVYTMNIHSIKSAYE